MKEIINGILLTSVNLTDTPTSFTTNDTILVFIVIVALFGIFFGVGITISTYPGQCWIKLIHKEPMHELNKYYFYYQKATAYRMLFMIHTIFSNTVKITGTTTTFITVYCAIDSNDFILLFSLITAMCQVIALLIPIDKYAKIFAESARLLEYELVTEYADEQMTKEKLKEAYINAEKIISQDFV